MPPPWILLDRVVNFVPEEAADKSTSEDEARSNRCRGKQSVVMFDPRKVQETMEDRVKAMMDSLQAMNPDPQVLEPPAINQLSMVYRTDVRLFGGLVSSSHESLVVLYAGHYQPGFTGSSTGCYLVYDASDNSLSPMPQLPESHTFRGLGAGAAILSFGKGSYLVAELVEARSGFPDAMLFLWQSPGQKKWIRSKVRLPPVFTPNFRFCIDMAFTLTESTVCWVDLSNGALVCDLRELAEPKFTFISLPVNSAVVRHRPRHEEFRTMGCVRGTIKFVALVGYNEGWPCEEIVLKTWTLPADLKGDWKLDRSLSVRDLWTSKSFLERGLPRITPLFPVINFDDPEVVYVTLDDVELKDAVDTFWDVDGVDAVRKALYVLGLNVVQGKVVCHTKIPDNLAPRLPYILPSEFSAYLQGSKDHQAGLEASEAGGSREGKKDAAEAGGSRERMKHASEAGRSRERKKHASEAGGSRERKKHASEEGGSRERKKHASEDGGSRERKKHASEAGGSKKQKKH